MSTTPQYGKKKNWWVQIGACSIGVIAVLLLLLKASRPTVKIGTNELVVYCAAGMRLPVEQAAQGYTLQYGLPIRLEYASSGDLESRLKLEAKYGRSRADLYIPANDFFAQRTRSEGITHEHIPLAKFKLVLAIKPGSDLKMTRLDDLLDKNIAFVLCNPKAAVGKFTQKILTSLGKYDTLDKAKKSTFTTVVEAANSVKTANDIQAGFMWDTTARQFNLDIIDLPELSHAVSSTSANLVEATHDTAAALRFARYLSAPQKGNLSFAKHFFSPMPGDTWAETPELTFFCGGLNKGAVEQTLLEFQQREGVQIRSHFAGCGALVSTMRSIKSNEKKAGFPDLYMTCDKTFYAMVQEDFNVGKDISTTDIILLVRRGNPKGITRLEDLAKPGVSFGTTDPKMSTLGFLSWKMFTETGLKQAVQGNAAVTTPTAHELVTQMTSHPKLDAVLVYVANCRYAKESCELIPINHPLAQTTQNIGASAKTPYPLLTERLINTLHASEKSKKRFQNNGFNWIKRGEGK